MVIPQATQSAIQTTRYTRHFSIPESLGVSMPTIYRWKENGTLPHPVKLTDSVIAFDVVEINNWLTTRLGEVA
ncbi:AlpA family phage regulatory protein [Pectobacterium polaris]|nr:AlpA family phage regulatory protein [Pectobacterium polaris]MBN3080949.1 AlpA family phage regulatory protein [Pectobacterium polaris]